MPHRVLSRAAVMILATTEDYDGYKCYRVATAEAAKLIEDRLTEARQSFKIKINISKKRGREFLVLLLDA
jgi:hypothetical protein